VGYGLVVGLDGTGDQTTQTPFTVQRHQSMHLPARRQHCRDRRNLQLKNVAAVMVTAQLLPAVRAAGDSSSTSPCPRSATTKRPARRHGCVLTPLKGRTARSTRWRRATSPSAEQGLRGRQQDAGQLAQRGPHSGRRDGRARGAAPVGDAGFLASSCATPTSASTRQVVDAINQRFGDGFADALDGRTVRVRAPAGPSARVAFLASSRTWRSTPRRRPRRSSSTRAPGSIVMNQAVTLDACAVAHGNLTVTIQSDPSSASPRRFPTARPSPPSARPST
jgi:flagellar P-ring protein precursor FlgI